MNRLWKAFIYTCDGLAAAFRHEVACRQEILVLLILVPVILLLPLSPLTRTVMIFAHLLVLVVELLNSAIEAVVDMVTPEFHPLAKRAKDYGSAAVFLTLLVCGGTWVLAVGELLGWS